MGSVDRVGDRSFKANFTVDGVLRLREKVNEKLKEFMGDYTDDTLVDYVIVLLKNGRQKEQAKNELNVFLGDDSDSFVCWLWDHLTLNIDLYVQPKEMQDGAPERIISEVQASGDDAQHLNSESDRGKSHKLSRRRHNKDWKGLVREETEPPTLRSSVVDNSHLEEKTRTKVDRHLRSPPPSPLGRRKRGHPDEQKTKRDAISQATINAPRRLLQFAVRDAVATSRPLNSGPYGEPSLKRLRSVVSTSSGDSSLAERPQRLQPVPRLSNPMSTVIKAVAEAAEDVMKFKSSGSVFDRLGRGMNPSDGSSHELEDDYQNQEQNQSMYLQRTDFSGQYASSNAMLEDEADSPSDYTSDNEGYNDENVMGHRGIGAFQIASSGGNRVDNLSMVQYSVAQNPDHNMHLKQNRDHEQPAAPTTSHKMVNISVNVNTWKSPQYQEPKEVAEMDGLKTRDSEVGPPRSCHQLTKDKASTLKVSNGNVNPAFNVQKESQKTQVSTSGGSGAAGRPLEDADSRTIFVSNVHFAATKDSLSRHFNKFGDVLKVVILVDAATGQPKGSAYVEFMRKESAENAISLDGTSFMSRILKVVKKSAAPQESTATMPWPRGVRGSSFPAARFSRAPFPRGVPGAFWSRPPMRVGARSMQWKRDAQGTTNPDSGASLNTSNIAVPAARGLTYVRTGSKPESS